MLTDIPDFSAVRILVAGDVMLDRYWHGDAVRISPEAPVPVVRVEEEEYRAGGAGNVALNISSLGATVDLFSVVGDDDASRQLDEILGAHGVDRYFTRVPGCTTIIKLRVISRHQQLIRIDFEDGFPTYPENHLPEEFERLLEKADLLVLSDYAKGTLRNVESFIATALRLGKPVLADPKGTEFSRYKGVTLITPNMAEFEAVVGSCQNEEQIFERGMNLIQELELEALLVTRGEMGMTLLERDRPARYLPTHAREVFDVTGAGDTVISVIATALAGGMPLEAATHLANVAAGVVVGKVGTASATLDEIQAALAEHEVIHHGVIEESELLVAIDAVRSRGETVVFTNGCFDILHAGHVAYLEQASRLGDRLVVAVNVDQTVRDLKGSDRPVNTQQQRMMVLAAMGCVDWVVSFSEATPERLICRLKPDFLVKGGDNQLDQIPGAECVRQAGGEVRIMGYTNDCSTTEIIRRIRGEERG